MTLPRRLPADVGPGTPGWLGERLRLVVQMFAPDTRTPPEWLWAGALAVAALMGGRVLGPPGAAGAATLVVLVPVVGPSLVHRRLRAVDRRRLPDRAGVIARAVRSGSSIPDALARAAGDELPTAKRWRRLVEQIELGRPLDEALAAEAAESESAERLLLAGLRVGAREGGAIAAATGTMAARLRQEVELEDRRRVLTTQARTSAQVLGVLPIVFVVVMVAVRGPDPWLRPLGLACLGVGVVLEVVGVFWMQRLLRGLR